MLLLVVAVLACTDTRAPPRPVGSCLDHPMALSPPLGQLPCDLIPPGTVLPR